MNGDLNARIWIMFRETDRRTSRVQTLSRMLLCTNEPENIKALLATQFKEFDLGIRYDAFKPLLGDGIFTLSQQGWYHSRQLLRPQFSQEEVARLTDLENHVQTLLKLFERKSKIGDGFFDVQELFFKFTLDSATEFLFGESIYSLYEDAADLLHDAKETQGGIAFGKAFIKGQQYLLLRMIAQRFYFLVSNSEFKEAIKVCHDFVDRYVRQAIIAQSLDSEKPTNEKDEEHHRYIFLHELAKETQDPVLMRDQALNILLAGRDTTAGLLSFTMSILSRHKNVFVKLREQILKEFDTDIDKISFHSLKRCDYLRYVINEVLRLYPIVPINVRQANKDTTLPRGGGDDEQSPIFIEKGTIVQYHSFTLHRDRLFWGENADDFVPERWADHKMIPWTYIPFNGGPRICLGQQFALTEASYVIVRILQTFSDFRSTAEHVNNPIKQRYNLTSSVSGGVPVHFTLAREE